jgi:hypothetical protein
VFALRHSTINYPGLYFRTTLSLGCMPRPLAERWEGKLGGVKVQTYTLSHQPGPSLSPVCANLLTADVLIGGARYVRTNLTLQLRVTWSKIGGTAKVHNEQTYVRCIELPAWIFSFTGVG